jgi:hypothetical protein
LILFFQDDYAQKAGIAPAPLSISDELKKEVSNYWLLASIQGKMALYICEISISVLFTAIVVNNLILHLCWFESKCIL